MSLLGEALTGQEQYAQAEPFLLAAQEGLKTHEEAIPESERDHQLRQAVQRLVALYTAWGKPEEAGKWQLQSIMYAVRNVWGSLEEAQQSQPQAAADNQPPQP